MFKGGISLSKCYPHSIERFSEDIDLTFLGMELSDKVCDKTIKKIEKVMTTGADTKKIDNERSNRIKSMFVWFGDKSNRVKLEIGSSVRPDPYSQKTVKTYLQEFLEEHNGEDDILKHEHEAVTLNVLNIERTFVDNLMSVKRHSICENINICENIKSKVRHIYDVTRLFALSEIKAFLEDKKELKRLIRITKDTDSYYLEKRGISKEYDPTGLYDFDNWKHHLTSNVRLIYENSHKELLYTDEQQNFDDAIKAFEEINDILKSIGE